MLKPNSSHSLFDADFPLTKPNVHDDKVLDSYTSFINLDEFEGGFSAPSSQTSAILTNFAATFSGQIQPHSSYLPAPDTDYRAQLNAGLESPLDDSPYSPPTDHFDTVCPSDTSPAWGNECLATPQLSMATLGLFGSASPETTDSHSTTVNPSVVHALALPAVSLSPSALSSTQESDFSTHEQEVDVKPVLPAADTAASPDIEMPEFPPLVEAVKAEAATSDGLDTVATPSDEGVKDEQEDDEEEYRPPTRGTKKRKASLPPSSSRSRSRSATLGATEYGPRDPVTGHRIFNGVRTKNSVQPVLALDAPIQSRKYIGASATSRKVVPKAMEGAVKRQVGGGSTRATTSARRIVEAFKEADESDFLVRGGEVPDEVRDAVKIKREQNTLAARESRKRKAEYVAGLEAEVERLREVELSLRARLQKYEKV